MFQPEVKLAFVQRYCLPKQGWCVYVDIDASEEGRAGGGEGDVARNRRNLRQVAAKRCRQRFQELGVQIGGSRKRWYKQNRLPPVSGDRDILAYQNQDRLLMVVEVEGDSSTQPEQKLYKAIGQLVVTCGNTEPAGWKRLLILVTQGQEMRQYLESARALERLGISGLILGDAQNNDRWVFGERIQVPLTQTDR